MCRIWVSASESIYQTSFASGLHAIPGLDAEAVLASGVTGFRTSSAVSADMLPRVVDVAVHALFNVFVAIAAFGAVGTLAVFGIEWKRIDVKKR